MTDERDDDEGVEVGPFYGGAPATPTILCASPDCPNGAGPEGFCADHEALAVASRVLIERQLAMTAQAKALDAVRAAAHRIVNAEKRETWRRRTKAEKAARKMAAKSRQRNRRG